jgi:hypothetical protein
MGISFLKDFLYQLFWFPMLKEKNWLPRTPPQIFLGITEEDTTKNSNSNWTNLS